MRRVVVTGMGALTPVGNNINDMWENVKKGVCGIDTITHYDLTDRAVTLAGEVKNFDPTEYIDRKEVRKMDRFVQYTMAASDEAIKNSGLDFDKEDRDRFGVLISSGIGGIETLQVEDGKGREKGYDRISPFFIPRTISNMAAAWVAIKNDLHGMCSCVVAACAGGTNAVGDAFHYIRDGYADGMICGGSEACITEFAMGGFTTIKAVTPTTDKNRASIPFDKERSGFVMGEGSAILVLEEYEHAVNRGADIICEVVGYGTNCDAYHMTAPLEDGTVASRCMTLALKDAGIAPEDIDYINAHGTSTHLNDLCETKAIRMAFGDHADKLMVSSTKSMMGHLLGAAGAVEACIIGLSLRDSFVPATINYKVPDEECDLDIVPNEGRNADIKYAMSNSLGFGGHNSVVIFKKYE